MPSRVAVIGAGPAGSAAALGLRRCSNVEVLLFDRYPFPRTKVCGSGLAPWSLKWLDEHGLGPQVRQHAFACHGATIGGADPRQPAVKLRGHHQTAVLRRKEFDEVLVREAQRRGAQLHDGVKVEHIVYDRRSPGGPNAAVGVQTDAGAFEVDAVIDCSGARGGFVERTKGSTTLHTMVGWYEGVSDTSDVVELYFDATVRPHYGWLFPETAERVNIGICFLANEGELNARQRFEAFLQRRFADRLRNATLLGRWVGHPAQTSAWPSKHLVRPGLLIAGEAGQLVDMATAEGIYHALVSGHLAGSILGDVLQRGDVPTVDHLKPYQKAVRQALAARMLGGRLLMEALRTSVFDRVLEFGQYKSVQNVLRRAFTGLYHG